MSLPDGALGTALGGAALFGLIVGNPLAHIGPHDEELLRKDKAAYFSFSILVSFSYYLLVACAWYSAHHILAGMLFILSFTVFSFLLPTYYLFLLRERRADRRREEGSKW